MDYFVNIYSFANRRAFKRQYSTLRAAKNFVKYFMEDAQRTSLLKENKYKVSISHSGNDLVYLEGTPAEILTAL